MEKLNEASSHDGGDMTLEQIAAGIGIGIVAGLVGTAVMTAAQMIEMQYTGRKPSNTPYKAVKKTFGIEAQSEGEKEFITNLTHVAYGTTWGIPRGLLSILGSDGAIGTTAHFGAVWGTELALLPAMDVIKPVTTWEPEEVAMDATFHAIYAVATGITADLLTKWLGKSYNGAHK